MQEWRSWKELGNGRQQLDVRFVAEDLAEVQTGLRDIEGDGESIKALCKMNTPFPLIHYPPKQYFLGQKSEYSCTSLEVFKAHLGGTLSNVV
ncbi:hypothetical protein WISP_123920 [Willisornis vidua]|uniref:Uncharacterized protein n=1 Tax=Willisornis vidua TaxID=1566151 RepID=A0ABQ9CWE6_9PASS|nr:hypothetical protein WISP_123920 [Willisornis vidua]